MKLIVKGKKLPLSGSGWLKGIKGNFNLDVVLVHQARSGI